MANLTELDIDPTLAASNQLIEEAAQQKKRTPPALNASTLGDTCERKLWYQFRMAKTEVFTAEQLKRFENGYRVEDVEASRLVRVNGVQLRTIDPVTGYPYAVLAVDGHLKGRLDGRIMGLLQAPKTEHVWECKCTNDKKYTALMKAKNEYGEKDALRHWDETYYAQAVLYMHLTGLTRHYLTCTDTGAIHTLSVRTEANPEAAERLLEKAARIKDAHTAPVGISDNPAWYQCKNCTFAGCCHQQQVAEVNCRTCCHSTPVANGEWHCAKYASSIPAHFQPTGCDNHLFLPSFIPYAKPIDADPDENWIDYQTATGTVFRNGNSKPAYSSHELSATQDYRTIGDSGVEKIRQAFDAEVIG